MKSGRRRNRGHGSALPRTFARRPRSLLPPFRLLGRSPTSLEFLILMADFQCAARSGSVKSVLPPSLRSRPGYRGSLSGLKRLPCHMPQLRSIVASRMPGRRVVADAPRVLQSGFRLPLAADSADASRKCQDPHCSSSYYRPPHLLNQDRFPFSPRPPSPSRRRSTSTSTLPSQMCSKDVVVV